eukprot:NODE_208_length_12861_cov_0.800972.p7 type:complete len:235 gc:universal NODE_208_length_12861_cov_0.800972:1472-2176(+)
MNVDKTRKIKLPPLTHFKERYAQIKDSRHDLGLQTEIKEIPITMREVQMETDLLLNRPPTPPYVPIKPGIDAEIQAEELFDFDLEVQPLLDIIVDQIVGDAYVKYYYDKELEKVHLQIQQHKDRQFKYLVELQKFELAEQDMHEQREKLMLQFAAAQDKASKEREQNKKAKDIQNTIGSILMDVELNLFSRKQAKTSQIDLKPEIFNNNLLSTPQNGELAEAIVANIILDAFEQ